MLFKIGKLLMIIGVIGTIAFLSSILYKTFYDAPLAALFLVFIIIIWVGAMLILIGNK